jgi:nucleoside-diphosphate-sugar epimerase
MKTVVIFGGTGFIGTHLSQFLLDDPTVQEVVVADMNPPRRKNYTTVLQNSIVSGRVKYLHCDVRQPLTLGTFPQVDVIFNLAAVHREPGHRPFEYYETNLRGAENVCAYASAVNCPRIVFMSSISPYGPGEAMKDETSIPVPETPYGGSKLVAEKMHELWQKAEPSRKLLIVRPGVVFGPGEEGNVTRLVTSLVRGYFLYMGNRRTRKAGGYVKELCRVISFGLKHQDQTDETVTTLNFSMDPPPTIEEFVQVITRIAQIRRKPLSIPRSFLLGASYPIDAAARLLGIRQPISPVRVRKLFRSTNIEPKRLREMRYVYHYSLEEAFEDWMRDAPEDFR